jgi:hypothetical protein
MTDETLLSYHNDPMIKQKYIGRVISHRKADAIIQGTGWENGRGCAVGCTLENYDHSQYPIELGLPEWIAYLEDEIFEGLTNQEAIYWPEKFLQAIPIGVNLENIKHKLAILRLDRLFKLQQENLDKNPDLKNVIEKIFLSINVVKQCHVAGLNKKYCDWAAAWSAAQSAAWSAWSAAWSARSAARSAWSAAWSARSAAWSARSAARSAWSAAWSARSAARSAQSAAESAWSAAWSWSAAWKQEAEDLLKLLSEAK